MTKAFDCVSHSIVLQKLYAYGVRGNVHKLLESYLENRRHVTEITKICPTTKTEVVYTSRPKQLKYGVPQGSVLGPLLFLVYINDLPLATKHHITLFADDSTVLFTGTDQNEVVADINHSLTCMIDWLDRNNLKINLNKTKIMNFRQRRNKSMTLNINYLDSKIDEIESTKFLGLYVDNQLNWKMHIEDVCKRINQSSFALRKLSKIVNRNSVITAYHGYVASILRYGLIFWGNSTDIQHVLRSQKRCIRSICNIRMTESCKPYFRELNILTVISMYIYECCVFVKHNPSSVEFHTRKRLADRLMLSSRSTALMHKSVFCRIPHIFNKLPKSLRECSNINTFKQKLYDILVKKCYYKLEEYLNDDRIE